MNLYDGDFSQGYVNQGKNGREKNTQNDKKGFLRVNEHILKIYDMNPDYNPFPESWLGIQVLRDFDILCLLIL